MKLSKLQFEKPEHVLVNKLSVVPTNCNCQAMFVSRTQLQKNVAGLLLDIVKSVVDFCVIHFEARSSTQAYVTVWTHVSGLSSDFLAVVTTV